MKRYRLLLPALLFVCAQTLAQTYILNKEEVSGTWTKANSPYIVQGEAIVPKGRTLTIQPGVVVKLAVSASFSTKYGDANTGMMKVEGRLLAQGTPNERIVFTRNAKESGHWGILLFKDSEDNILEYCTIEYGGVMETIFGETFARSLSLFNSYALIKNTCVANSSDVSIQCTNSSPDIINCTVVNGNNTAIYTPGTGSANVKNTIVWQNSAAFGSDCKVSYCLYKASSGETSLGHNIIGTDPEFKDAAKNDFTLKASSPCIGAGENGVDIGAFPFKIPPPIETKSKDNTPPEISIYEPLVGRGLKIIETRKQILVKGKTTDPSGIYEVLINGADANVTASGEFQQSVKLAVGDNVVTITATDTRSNTETYTFYVNRQSEVAVGSWEPVETVPVKKEKRLALVIGNSNYGSGKTLKNPVNDANLMAKTLQGLDFEVIKRIDANKQTIEQAIREFSKKLPNTEVALFYYAGHGVQVDGMNYLIPTDANLDEKSDCKFEAISVNYVVEEFEKYPNNVNVVILDACRNDPFRSWARGSERGFKAISPSSGTIISFATSEGATASDGGGSNGLFTEQLVKQMSVSQPIESVFKKTRIEVEQLSRGGQSPQEWSKLKGDFFFKK